MAGGEHALFVAFGNDHQRAVDRQDVVEEDGDVHRARLGHAVVARPGAVILMPLPDIALEGSLGVELELVDVNGFAEQLHQRLDQPWMLRHHLENLIEFVRGKCGARRAGLLAPDLLAIELEDVVGLGTQQRDLFLGEAIGEEDVTLFVEGLELLGTELHGRRLPEYVAAVDPALFIILAHDPEKREPVFG